MNFWLIFFLDKEILVDIDKYIRFFPVYFLELDPKPTFEFVVEFFLENVDLLSGIEVSLAGLLGSGGRIKARSLFSKFFRSRLFDLFSL